MRLPLFIAIPLSLGACTTDTCTYTEDERTDLINAIVVDGGPETRRAGSALLHKMHRACEE